MMPDGEKERQQWKAALAPSDECLTLDELSHANSSVREGAEDRASSHLARCARCQTELAMLKEFERAAPRGAEAPAVSWIAAELKRRSGEITEVTPKLHSRRPAPVSLRGTGRRSFFAPGRLSAAAMSIAALLLVVTVGHYLRTRAEPPLLSDGAGPAVLRSEGVVPLAPRGDLEDSPTELRWQPVPGAARYSVDLMEVDRAVLWQSTSEEASVALPQAVREKIVPGKTLLWQVTAIEPGGKAVATSPAQRFRLAVKPRANP